MIRRIRVILVLFIHPLLQTPPVYAIENRSSLRNDGGDKGLFKADQGQFTFTAGPDAPGPTQVLTRAAEAQVFLLVRYSL